MMIRLLRFALLTIAAACVRLAMRGTTTRHASFRRSEEGLEVTMLDDFTHEDYRRAFRHAERPAVPQKKGAPCSEDAPR